LVASNPASSSLPSSSMSTRSGSPTRNVHDSRNLLLGYGIQVDTGRALSTDLQEHLDKVLLEKRDGPGSPNADNIAHHRHAAQFENESTAIQRLRPLLLFAGQDGPGVKNPVQIISSKLYSLYRASFFPNLHPTSHCDGYCSLSRIQSLDI
jgi:hypothetical protein